MLPFLFLGIGLLLILFEFYLPGGVLGTVGAAVLISSIVIFSLEHNSPIAILIYIAFVVMATFGLIKYALWRIRHAKPGTSIYLEGDQEGFTASAYDESTIGKEGIVDTDLRPGGHIVVEGKKHLAISVSGYIGKGEEVVVTGGEGEVLKVILKKFYKKD